MSVDMLPRLKKNALRISFIVVSLSLVVIVIAHELSIYKLKETQVIYLSVFSRIVKIPNYFILETGIADEINLKDRRNQRIVIGSSTRLKRDFLDYLRKSTIVEHEKCGLMVLTSKTDNIANTLVYDSKSYMWFVGVEAELVEKVIGDICSEADVTP